MREPSLLGSGASGSGMVHLGVGAFARAHPLWCTALAADNDPGPWAVCAVAQRSRTVVDALRAAGWSYDVELRDDDGSQTVRVGVVRDGLVAADDPDRLVTVLAAPAVTVVTLTATEAGYPCDPVTRRLDVSHAGVKADLRGAGPSTVVGQVVAAAAMRARTGAGPVSFVVCDNVLNGGDLLGSLAIDLARRSGQDDAAAWLSQHAAFPNGVVDRVVPAVPASREPTVVAEPWFRWVLEDAFTAPRPAWESAGARVVDDATPWQAAKLHLVNAPHSMLAYLGLACGLTYVHEAVREPLLRAAVETAMDSELMPTVPSAAGLSAPDDAAASLRRFANSAVPYRLTQVASGGSTKLPQRLCAVIEQCVVSGRAPTWSTAAVAGWAHGVLRDDVDEPREAEVRAALNRPPRDRALALLELSGLPQHDIVVDRLTEWLAAFDGADVRSAIGGALKE